MTEHGAKVQKKNVLKLQKIKKNEGGQFKPTQLK